MSTSAMSNPSQLFLLADHIKLSLLERQRAISLNLSPNSHDGQISRSLESLQSGISAIESQLSNSEDATLRDQLYRLQTQYQSLSSEFSPSSNPSASDNATLKTPNTSNLTSDFRATQILPQKNSSLKRNPSTSPALKSVRFSDNPSSGASQGDPNFTSAADAGLFPYRDDPADAGTPDQSQLSNQQIHAYHSSVLQEQDSHLDTLSSSIRTQRELSIQIGDELDGQALLLDEVDEGVDRHQGSLDRARGRLEKFSRKARENWSMTTIIVLIVVLVLLIVILK
ncbi:hypothetical protein K402DRAFT_465017 [Aulographum hederae CBS 113979]|uniref:t-SNARE coiled-coil homology domain-containing protein n=1 Tax=Aulographum hederae CBS 113979 TaxID=1176131 RepID=A0A6G1GVF8_9PEZI|nr:hypothetical protein K402DRAFT_465017 [Aulographum hederae CBS 113979]